MEQWTVSELGKEYVKAEYCHPAYLTYIQSTSCEMPGWMMVSRLPREISITSDADDITLMAESKEKLKSLLKLKEERESEKAGWKLNIQKTNIMSSGPITSWQMDGETVETVTDFIFFGSKITINGDCSHKIKTLAPLKESYDKPRQHIKKQKLLYQQRST